MISRKSSTAGIKRGKREEKKNTKKKNERASGQDFSQANYDACRYKKSATTSATTTTTTTGSWSNRKAYSFWPIPCRSKCLCYTASLVSGRHKTQRVRLELGDTVQNRVPLCILSLLERTPLRWSARYVPIKKNTTKKNQRTTKLVKKREEASIKNCTAVNLLTRKSPLS